MFENEAPANDLLERELKELETLGQRSMPSLNAFLQKHNLFMTKQDLKTLRSILVKNKKWKLVKVTDYQIVRRGKQK